MLVRVNACLALVSACQCLFVRVSPCVGDGFVWGGVGRGGKGVVVVLLNTIVSH